MIWQVFEPLTCNHSINVNVERSGLFYQHNSTKIQKNGLKPQLENFKIQTDCHVPDGTIRKATQTLHFTRSKNLYVKWNATTARKTACKF